MNNAVQTMVTLFELRLKYNYKTLENLNRNVADVKILLKGKRTSRTFGLTGKSLSEYKLLIFLFLPFLFSLPTYECQRILTSASLTATLFKGWVVGNGHTPQKPIECLPCVGKLRFKACFNLSEAFCVYRTCWTLVWFGMLNFYFLFFGHVRL